MKKIIIFSSLISVNVVIWYEILGMRFLIGVLLFVVIWFMKEEGGSYDKTRYSNRGRGISPFRYFKKYYPKTRLERKNRLPLKKDR